MGVGVCMSVQVGVCVCVCVHVCVWVGVFVNVYCREHTCTCGACLCTAEYRQHKFC